MTPFSLSLPKGARPALCLPRGKALEILVGKHGEAVIGCAVSKVGELIELWTSLDGSTWMLVVGHAILCVPKRIVI